MAIIFLQNFETHSIIIYFWLHSIIFQPFDWIRNFVHFPMNKKSKIERNFFFINKMAALLGFIEESHEKLKQGPALYQTSFLYKT